MKFKVGDRVKITKIDPKFRGVDEKCLDKIGNIINEKPGDSFDYRVRFEDEHTHDNSFKEWQLELAEEQEEKEEQEKECTWIYSPVYPFYTGIDFGEETPKKGVKTMLSILAKKLLDGDVKALVEVGWLDNELEVTEKGEKAVFALFVEQNKAELAKRAKDELKKNKSK